MTAVDWIRLGQDIDQWRLLQAEMDFWVPYNVQMILTCYATISFSLRVTHNTSECIETAMTMGTVVIINQPC